MKSRILTVLFALASLTVAADKPNIIFILADDWGLGDVKTYGGDRSINGSFAIRQGNWKLNFCPGSGGWTDPRPKNIKAEDVQDWVQLYDLAIDPAETQNLAKENPETVERLTQLAQHYIDNGRSTAGTNQKNNGETYLYPSWIRSARP